MRALFSNRAMSCIALVLLLLLPVSCAAAKKTDRMRVVSAGISASVHWQNKWFGESFGSRCVERRLTERQPIKFLLEMTPAAKHGGDAIAVHVGGSNVMYSGVLWSTKASLEPSLGHAHGCEVGELAPNVDFGTAGGIAISGPEGYGDQMQERALTDHEKSDVDAYLRNVLKATVKEHSLKERVLVGNYGRQDPFFIVCDQGLERCYFVLFPPVDLMPTLQGGSVTNAEIFLGPDGSQSARTRSGKRLRARMSSNSFRLELEH